MVFLVFIIGLLLGSFFLVVGLRVPKGEDALFSRSKCDTCHHPLKWYNLISIVSYLIQKGRCSYCHDKISPLNIIVELAMGMLLVIGYILFGFSYQFFMYAIIVSLSILIFITDFIYMIILDSVLIISCILVIILKLIYLSPYDVLVSLLSAVALFSTMYFIQYCGGKIFKKESLGGGDVKLAFVMGLILNFRLGLVALIFSTFLALPYSVASLYLTKNHEVPYGPFLAGALLIIWIFLDKFKALLIFIFGI